MDEQDRMIGRVTRCSTRGFVGARRLPEPEIPTFGDFCQAEAQRGRSRVIGLIYDISVADDELARQLASAEDTPAEQIADGQQSRQIPVEISALSVGYADAAGFHQTLPPQPPLTLSPIQLLPPDEIRGFTERLDFLNLVLAADVLPVEPLLAAALARAARARPDEQRRPFLVRSARQAAGMLASDLDQLNRLIESLGPIAAEGSGA
jgi:hypothetical protein